MSGVVNKFQQQINVFCFGLAEQRQDATRRLQLNKRDFASAGLQWPDRATCEAANVEYGGADVPKLPAGAAGGSPGFSEGAAGPGVMNQDPGGIDEDAIAKLSENDRDDALSSLFDRLEAEKSIYVSLISSTMCLYSRYTRGLLRAARTQGRNSRVGFHAFRFHQL